MGFKDLFSKAKDLVVEGVEVAIAQPDGVVSLTAELPYQVWVRAKRDCRVETVTVYIERRTRRYDRNSRTSRDVVDRITEHRIAAEVDLAAGQEREFAGSFVPRGARRGGSEAMSALSSGIHALSNVLDGLNSALGNQDEDWTLGVTAEVSGSINPAEDEVRIAVVD